MKQFHFILLFIFSIIGGKGVAVNLNAAASYLEMYVFSVGQGNFILLKKDIHFLAVDAGCGAQGRNPLKLYKDKMRERMDLEDDEGKLRKKLNAIVSSSTEKNLFLLVTHNHWDHFCLFKHLKDFFNQIQVPGWIQRLAESFFEVLWEPSASKFEIIQELQPGDLPPNCLGEGISIDCLLPHTNAEKAHEKNLIVFVRCGTVLFILPGDADGDYLNLNAEAFMNKLREQSYECTQCCIVLPHHGSNSNGTLALTLAAHRVLQEAGCQEVIFIISSDPGESNYLPRPAVFPLLPNAPSSAALHWYQDFSEKPIAVSGSVPMTCITTDGIGVWTRQMITSPVFVTCEAGDNTGYLVTTNGSSLQLYDGASTQSGLLYSAQ
ncbi:MAG: MBL fold metallo-hydrolase [Holosporaceae bacterium]|jgi:hypothetical protein|nr:MBL fold metallo-hydrolase [Holosporaceae bacterium]